MNLAIKFEWNTKISYSTSLVHARIRPVFSVEYVITTFKAFGLKFYEIFKKRNILRSRWNGTVEQIFTAQK